MFKVLGMYFLPLSPLTLVKPATIKSLSDNTCGTFHVNFFEFPLFYICFIKMFNFSSWTQFWQRVFFTNAQVNTNNSLTPPLWRDLVKILTIKLWHTSSFSLERTDFKNVIFEKIPWAPSEVAEVAEVKQPRNLK